MKPIIIRQKLKNSGLVIASLSLMFLALGAASCTRYSKRLQVRPVENNSLLNLNSDEIVRVMRRAGFSDKQIMDYGEDLHYALAESGAAEIRRSRRVLAVFAIHGDSVYIGTRTNNYIYNVNSGWVSGSGGGGGQYGQ